MVRGVCLALLLLGSFGTPAAATEQEARNCELLSVGTGEMGAPSGFLPDQIEVTFCGNRRLSDAELRQFTSLYQLTLVQIVSPADQSLNAYYFRVAARAWPPDRVRVIASHPDVRSVSVVPCGVAAGLAPGTIPRGCVTTLPATSTGSAAGEAGSALPGAHDSQGGQELGAACVAAGLLLALLPRRARRTKPARWG